jgi:hypothetical protein
MVDVSADPAVDWLLQSVDPSIRYLTLTEVVGRPSNDAGGSRCRLYNRERSQGSRAPVGSRRGRTIPRASLPQGDGGLLAVGRPGGIGHPSPPSGTPTPRQPRTEMAHGGKEDGTGGRYPRQGSSSRHPGWICAGRAVQFGPCRSSERPKNRPFASCMAVAGRRLELRSFADGRPFFIPRDSRSYLGPRRVRPAHQGSRSGALRRQGGRLSAKAQRPDETRTDHQGDVGSRADVP